MPKAAKQGLGHGSEKEKAESLRRAARLGNQHDRRRTEARGGVSAAGGRYPHNDADAGLDLEVANGHPGILIIRHVGMRRYLNRYFRIVLLGLCVVGIGRRDRTLGLFMF